MEIVERHVQDAIDKGARVLTGGKRTGEGLVYPPTVLVDVDHTMECMTEETFGPTLPVMKVAGEAEAIRLANDSTYGLNGSVWTADNERGDPRRPPARDRRRQRQQRDGDDLPVPAAVRRLEAVRASACASAAPRACSSTAAAVGDHREDQASAPRSTGTRTARAQVKLQSRLVRMLGAHDWRRRLGGRRGAGPRAVDRRARPAPLGTADCTLGRAALDRSTGGAPA